GSRARSVGERDELEGWRLGIGGLYSPISYLLSPIPEGWSAPWLSTSGEATQTIFQTSAPGLLAPRKGFLANGAAPPRKCMGAIPTGTSSSSRTIGTR